MPRLFCLPSKRNSSRIRILTRWVATFVLSCSYLHVNGFIHRDIKAANLLIDDDGTVLLGDLGVAVSLSEEPSPSRSSQKPSSDTQSGYYYSTSGAAVRDSSILSSSTVQSSSTATTIPFPATSAFTNHGPSLTFAKAPHLGRRRSFVGTPCWMAPEIIAASSSASSSAFASSSGGYNASADIYSLGITALELAHGRAPHSLDPPYKALLKTLQNASPTLDRTGGGSIVGGSSGTKSKLLGSDGGDGRGKFKYSQTLKDIIDQCLKKDPSKRPTAAELLALPYFKSAKKKGYLVGVLGLEDLPPLDKRQERVRRGMSICCSSITQLEIQQLTIIFT